MEGNWHNLKTAMDRSRSGVDLLAFAECGLSNISFQNGQVRKILKT